MYQSSKSVLKNGCFQFFNLIAVSSRILEVGRFSWSHLLKNFIHILDNKYDIGTQIIFHEFCICTLSPVSELSILLANIVTIITAHTMDVYLN